MCPVKAFPSIKVCLLVWDSGLQLIYEHRGNIQAVGLLTPLFGSTECIYIYIYIYAPDAQQRGERGDGEGERQRHVVAEEDRLLYIYIYIYISLYTHIYL